MNRAAVAVLFLVACASETVEAPPPVPANWRAIDAPPPVPTQGPTAKERAIAEAYVAALASPNLAGIGAMFDEIGHAAFGRHDARGREKVIELHQDLFGAFDNRKSTAQRVWHTDDRQIVEWVMTGVHARPWMGVAPTQRPVVIRGMAFLWTQDQGSVSDAHVYFSVPVVKAELGIGSKELQDYIAALPPPGPPSPPLDEQNSQEETINEKVVRDMLDNFEKSGKENEFLGAYAEDVQVETLWHAKTDKKEDVHAYYRMMRRLIGQLDTTIVSVQPVQKYVLLEYFISGEQFGAIGLTPAPTGSDHAAWLEYAEVLLMTDDHKINHVWRYENPEWPQ